MSCPTGSAGISLLWNRTWTEICDVKPTMELQVDNSAALPLDIACYVTLQRAPVSSRATLVYVPAAGLHAFLQHVWPAVHASARIILVTGRSDRGPAASLGLPTLPRWQTGKAGAEEDRPHTVEPAAVQGPLRGCLEDDRLAAWWSENLDFSHPKARPLPIGVDLHTLASARAGGRAYWGQPKSAHAQAQELLHMGRTATPAMERDGRVFVHFGLVNRRRLAVLQRIKDNPCYAIAAGMPGATASVTAGKEGKHHVDRQQLWREMAKYRWVASIEGYGVDCHRTWEALYLGCGVVVQDTPFLRRLLHGFPALFVPGSPSAWDSYITQEALDNEWVKWQAGNAGREVQNSPTLDVAKWVSWLIESTDPGAVRTESE